MNIANLLHYLKKNGTKGRFNSWRNKKTNLFSQQSKQQFWREPAEGNTGP